MNPFDLSMSSENISDFTGDATNLPKSKLAFDFEVPERPIYIPNSGPPLQPISLIPPHKLKGIVLDCFPYPRRTDPSHFLVGYEKEPHTRLVIHPDNIRNYVSEYTLENWEHERSTAEEKRAIKELQPRLKAAERARVLRQLKRAGVSRDVLKGEDAEHYQALAMPKRRGRPPKSMASVFKPEPKPLPLPHLPGGKRGEGRRRREVKVHVSSPTLPHHHQPSLSQPSLSQPSLSQPSLSQPSLSQPSLSQPSLSQPSLSQPSLSKSFSTAPRAMLEHAISTSESESAGEDDETDLALHLQIDKEANPGSRSAVKSPAALRASSPAMTASDQIHKTHLQSPQKSKCFKKSPHNRPHQAPPILPGMSVDEYQYKNPNTRVYNKSKNMSNKGNSGTQQQHQTSLKHPSVPSQMKNGEQSTSRTFHGTIQGSQGKIVDYFKYSGTRIPTPKTVQANRLHQPVSNLKRKSSSSLGEEGETNGKSQRKSQKIDPSSNDYLDADYTYKEPSNRGIRSAINDRSPSFDASPNARNGSDAFNPRGPRSQSRRLESSPDDEDGDEDRYMNEGTRKREPDSEEAYANDPSIWAVKAILNHKYQWNQDHDQQELWYFVDWEGDWDPSWEPASLVSNGAVDEYIASRKARGHGDPFLSMDAMDIGRGGNGLSRGQ